MEGVAAAGVGASESPLEGVSGSQQGSEICSSSDDDNVELVEGLGGDAADTAQAALRLPWDM